MQNTNGNTARQNSYDYYNQNSQFTPNAIANSYFDGYASQLMGWNLLCSVITVVTLGFGLPWAICLKLRWETKHTVINGKRLYFNGTASQLFGRLIGWYLLMAVIFIVPIIIALASAKTKSFSYWSVSVYHFDYEKAFVNLILAVIFDVIAGNFIVAAYSVYLKKWVTMHTTFIDDNGRSYEHHSDGTYYYPTYQQNYGANCYGGDNQYYGQQPPNNYNNGTQQQYYSNSSNNGVQGSNNAGNQNGNQTFN